jgi:protein-tyrosine phosphatase/nicotinamidase-related amidase
MKSILLTQCLQNDFVAPLGPWDAMPCLLHIGSAEAGRLIGTDPDDGPVTRFLDWAHGIARDALEIVHIRDWHDPSDPDQAEHLGHFGAHCLQGTSGADFVFALPESARKRVELVDSITLNDFIQTNLESILQRILPGVKRIGIIGAWTDAKVGFLAYEMRTRYPELEIGVCSALTASSSRERHLLALDHLERIIGVRIFHSVGDFSHFLLPQGERPEELERKKSYLGSVVIDCDTQLRPTDKELLAWLFRSSSSLKAHCLDGGFSGNVVLRVESLDLEGRKECPHVVKIGPRAAIGQERISFETIEPILGNSAPRIADFSDLAERGGLKYRYASMTSGKSRTFQSLWMSGLDDQHTAMVIKTVFEEQLGRLYQAAAPEQVDLLEIWGFDPKWADGVEAKVRALGVAEPGQECALFPGLTGLPVVPFYRETIARAQGDRRELAPMARVHGDLNGANILVDDHHNVWLIDFFHSRRHHVVGDFVKLENDLLHIWTFLPDENALRSFAKVLQALQRVTDMGEPLPAAAEAGVPEAFARTWETLRLIRAAMIPFIGVFRDPWQHRIAALRYAVHTLGFDEPNRLQKQGALVHAGLLARACREHMEQDRRLRVDWIPLPGVPGRMGLTILPGRGDRSRSLSEDIDQLAKLKTDLVVSLVTEDELAQFGVSTLPSALAAKGMECRRLPILDQKACTVEQAHALAQEILKTCQAGRNVVIHCVGGLGRSGMIAACVAVMARLDPSQAIALVRKHRSPRALETQSQIDRVWELARILV